MSDLLYKIILAVVILSVIAVVGYYLGYDQDFGAVQGQSTATPTALSTSGTPTPVVSVSPSPSGEDEAVFCAQDVMECPDGSFVSRMPPSCDFAPCAGR